MSRPRILYIDDEQVNLTNFQQAFGKTYEVFTAATGEEALALLAREGEMALVISDQRMPGISGVDVLTRVGELHPDSVRLVITAFTEVSDLIDAINRGHIYKYIVKPWEEASLGITLLHAAERYQLAKKNQELMARLIQVNGELEQRVEQRTGELREANNSLAQSNQDLNQAQAKLQAQAGALERLNRELTVKVAELEEALDKVKVLQDLLPICSYCKKIRDDQNYWQELESYLYHHADVAFTHSICPDCYNLYVKADLERFQAEAKRREELNRR